MEINKEKYSVTVYLHWMEWIETNWAKSNQIVTEMGNKILRVKIASK